MDNEFQDIFKSQINDESDNDFTETKKEELTTIDPDFEKTNNKDIIKCSSLSFILT